MSRLVVPLISLVALLHSTLGDARAQMPSFPVPERGTRLPDVTVYDEHGEPFTTKSLRGRYSVLVFGCLT